MDSLLSSKDYVSIPDFPGYAVTASGEIISLPRRISNGKGTFVSKVKVLKGNPISNGYLQVKLYKDGKKYHRLVHVLVAKAYVDNPHSDIYDQVNHKDGDKQNNHADNLEWCNNSKNQLHAWRMGMQPQKRSIRTSGGVPCAEVDSNGNIIKSYSHMRHAEIEIFGDCKNRIACALRHGGRVQGHKFIKL